MLTRRPNVPPCFPHRQFLSPLRSYLRESARCLRPAVRSHLPVSLLLALQASEPPQRHACLAALVPLSSATSRRVDPRNTDLPRRHKKEYLAEIHRAPVALPESARPNTHSHQCGQPC